MASAKGKFASSKEATTQFLLPSCSLQRRTHIVGRDGWPIQQPAFQLSTRERVLQVRCSHNARQSPDDRQKNKHGEDKDRNDGDDVDGSQISTRKRLDIAIVGAPNAGKSQLLNAIVGTTVAAVSRKRHTTRNGIVAALTENDTQLVFVDTPGFVTHRQAGGDGVLAELVKRASEEATEADFTLVVVDAAKHVTEELRKALAFLMWRAVHSTGRDEISSQFDDQQNEKKDKFALVVNKVDLVSPKIKLLELVHDLGHLADECVRRRNSFDESSVLKAMQQQNRNNEAPLSMPNDSEWDNDEYMEISPSVFYTAAIGGSSDEGVRDVVRHLLNRATITHDDWPVAPGDAHGEEDDSSQWHNPQFQTTATTMTILQRVEEVIREKLYRCLHREVPHQVEQVNRLFNHTSANEGGLVVRIDQDLIVRTESHRRLVLGRGGQTLKRIHETAHRDLSQLLFSHAKKVQLNLHVKLLRKKRSHARDLMSHHAPALSERTMS